MIGSMVGFRKAPTTLALYRLIVYFQGRGGVGGVKSVVDMTGLGTWWRQRVQGRGGVNWAGAVAAPAG